MPAPTAVMARRLEPHDSLDFFPTPPWGARALIEHALRDRRAELARCTAWEPACGQGHMARALAEYFSSILSTDVHPYGFGAEHDFLMPWLPEAAPAGIDWIITNPPFRLGREFVERALQIARAGVAMLVRTAFLESDDRYQGLYRTKAPTLIAQFVERLPMIKGRVDPEASSATAYAWLVWMRSDGEWMTRPGRSEFTWIPACRSQMERPGDYLEAAERELATPTLFDLLAAEAAA